jgi:hypothetical protein
LIRANDKNFIIQHVQYFIYTYKLWLCWAKKDWGVELN